MKFFRGDLGYAFRREVDPAKLERFRVGIETITRALIEPAGGGIVREDPE